VAAFILQINIHLWDWVKQLFQDYQDATEVLTPLENNTWMANTVLQVVNAVHQKKREVEPDTPSQT
jgi:hypothetical protein